MVKAKDLGAMRVPGSGAGSLKASFLHLTVTMFPPQELGCFRGMRSCLLSPPQGRLFNRDERTVTLRDNTGFLHEQ